MENTRGVLRHFVLMLIRTPHGRFSGRIACQCVSLNLAGITIKDPCSAVLLQRSIGLGGLVLLINPTWNGLSAPVDIINVGVSQPSSSECLCQSIPTV